MSLAIATAPEVLNPSGGKAGKRTKAARAASRPIDQRSKKVSVYLSHDALKRLDVHVAMDGGDRSHLIEQLILDGLKRYEMPRRRSEATLPVGEIGSDPTV
jgi:Ribbon-helix-helix protein, copG family